MVIDEITLSIDRNVSLVRALRRRIVYAVDHKGLIELDSLDVRCRVF